MDKLTKLIESTTTQSKLFPTNYPVNIVPEHLVVPSTINTKLDNLYLVFIPDPVVFEMIENNISLEQLLNFTYLAPYFSIESLRELLLANLAGTFRNNIQYLFNQSGINQFYPLDFINNITESGIITVLTNSVDLLYCWLSTANTKDSQDLLKKVLDVDSLDLYLTNTGYPDIKDEHIYLFSKILVNFVKSLNYLNNLSLDANLDNNTSTNLDNNIPDIVKTQGLASFLYERICLSKDERVFFVLMPMGFYKDVPISTEETLSSGKALLQAILARAAIYHTQQSLANNPMYKSYLDLLSRG